MAHVAEQARAEPILKLVIYSLSRYTHPSVPGMGIATQSWHTSIELHTMTYVSQLNDIKGYSKTRFFLCTGATLSTT